MFKIILILAFIFACVESTGFHSLSNCSNHGVFDKKQNKCACDVGYISETNCSAFVNGDLKQITERSSCNDSVNDCDSHGYCLQGSCICTDAYASVKGSSVQCTYERKSQLTAFLLHIFLCAFGAGHWYIGNIGYAMGQLALGVIIPCAGYCCLCCVVCIFMKTENPKAAFGGIGGCLLFCCWIGLTVWWVVDIVRFAQNYYLDSNGYALKPW
jgi:hypothetical protein